MHEVINTETIDAADELFWPQKYKHILRSVVKSDLINWLRTQNIAIKIYERDPNQSFEMFLEHLAEKIVIGSENGADDAFEKVHGAFNQGMELPHIPQWTNNVLENVIFSNEVRCKIKNSIIDEYSLEHLYEHFYQDYYMDKYPTFDLFVEKVSEVAMSGLVNGAEKILQKIIRSFGQGLPLPPARRYPRYLKVH